MLVEDPEDLSIENNSDSVGDDDNDDEWSGIGGGGEAGPPHSSGKPVKVPAGHELREMKEASELYKSSAFKLQVRIRRSLLSEIPRSIFVYGVD